MSDGLWLFAFITIPLAIVCSIGSIWFVWGLSTGFFEGLWLLGVIAALVSLSFASMFTLLSYLVIKGES